MPELSSSSYSETDASNNSASPNGMPEGMAPSGVNDSWRAGMGAIKRAWNRLNGKNASAGGTTSYTLTPDVALAAYVNGERYSFRVNVTNTGASDLAISGLAAKNIKKVTNGAKAALAAGDLVAKAPCTVEYGSTDDEFVLCTPPGTLVTTALASSTSASGIIELATQAEVDTGTDAVRAVAPSTLTGWTPGVASVTFDKANDKVLITDNSASGVLKQASLSTLALSTDIGLTLIQAQSPSGVASVDFTTGISSTYNVYLIVGNLKPATDDVELWLRTDANGGASFDATAGDYKYSATMVDSGGTTLLNSNSDTELVVAGNTAASRSVGSDADQGAGFAIWMYTPASAAFAKRFVWQSGYEQADDGAWICCNGGGMRNNTSAINAFQLLFESGNIASGHVALYGVRAS